MRHAVRAKVVDASAVAALIFGEPSGEAVKQAIAGAALMAPALLPIEICSVFLAKLKKEPSQRLGLVEGLGRYSDLDVQLHNIDPTALAVTAREYGLSAYDGSYLLLAKSLELELVTLDKQLARAAFK